MGIMVAKKLVIQSLSLREQQTRTERLSIVSSRRVTKPKAEGREPTQSPQDWHWLCKAATPRVACELQRLDAREEERTSLASCACGLHQVHRRRLLNVLFLVERQRHRRGRGAELNERDRARDAHWDACRAVCEHLLRLRLSGARE